MSRVVMSRGASRVRPGHVAPAPRWKVVRRSEPREARLILEKGGMRSRKTRQCRENFPHMPTHGLFSCLRIALFQRADNVTMLLDQHWEGRGLGQAEMAHAIGLGARSFDHAHRVIAIDTVGDSPMEGLIQFGEGHVIKGSSGTLLRRDEFTQAIKTRRIDPPGGLAHDGAFNSLTHEAGIENLLHGDFRHIGAATGKNLHEPSLRELDEGLAHGWRLTP